MMCQKILEKKAITSSCRALRLEPPRVAPPPPPPSLPLLLSLTSGRWTGCLEQKQVLNCTYAKVGMRISENPRLCANKDQYGAQSELHTLVSAENC